MSISYYLSNNFLIYANKTYQYLEILSYEEIDSEVVKCLSYKNNKICKDFNNNRIEKIFEILRLDINGFIYLLNSVLNDKVILNNEDYISMEDIDRLENNRNQIAKLLEALDSDIASNIGWSLIVKLIRKTLKVLKINCEYECKFNADYSL